MCVKSLIDPRSKQLVYIHAEVNNLIQGFRQIQCNDPEAGGILIGKRRGRHLEVTLASPPQKEDVRSRYKFVRSPVGHQEIAEARWRASDGEENYLGEWHTHPQIDAYPSGLDLKEWKILAHKHKTPLLFIIVGLESNYFAINTQSGLMPLDKAS